MHHHHYATYTTINYPNWLCNEPNECTKNCTPTNHTKNKPKPLTKRQYLNNHKTLTGCQHCGNKTLPPHAYDLDHTNPKTKKHAPTKLTKQSWKTIHQELDKCQVLCANCHRIKTHNDQTA